MENSVRNEALPLEQSILQNPRAYSFEMAVKILGSNSKINYGKELSIRDAPFRTVNINSFYLRGTEISKIIEEDGTKVIFIERLSLSGLNAPLPTPYAEILYNRSLERDFAFSRFLNTFSSRLLGISYQISKRRYMCLQADNHKNYLVLKTLMSFIGGHAGRLDYRLSRLAYLFWTKEKSASGLEAVIHYLFDLQVRVSQLMLNYMPNNNVKRLGEAVLGKSADLGKSFLEVNTGINIHLFSNDYQKICDLLTVPLKRKELMIAIRKYVGNFIKFWVFATPGQVPPLNINHAILGKTSWLTGKKLDAARV